MTAVLQPLDYSKYPGSDENNLLATIFGFGFLLSSIAGGMFFDEPWFADWLAINWWAGIVLLNIAWCCCWNDDVYVPDWLICIFRPLMQRKRPLYRLAVAMVAALTGPEVTTS